MGVAFRELPLGRSRWRLPQSRDRGLQGSTHCGYCVHGSHLLPMDHDRRHASTPATRCATGIMPVAVSLSNASPTATPSSVMSLFTHDYDRLAMWTCLRSAVPVGRICRAFVRLRAVDAQVSGGRAVLQVTRS